MSDALNFDQLSREVKILAEKVDRMKYNGRFQSNQVGQDLAGALSSLTEGYLKLQAAAQKQALVELKERERE